MTILSKVFNPLRELNPIKNLGQNFLCDSRTIADLIDASIPKSTDIYLEIGPGQGAVTKILAPKVKKVLAVELDKNLAAELKLKLEGSDSVEVVHDDILHFLRDHVLIHDRGINKIIGSIPYQITSPLFHQLAESCQVQKIENVTLLIQKEVADKVTTEAPHANYLSNFLQTYFEVTYIRTVSKDCFYPVPKVDGAIVKLQPKTTNYQLLTTTSTEWSAFLHQGFKFPRKMLKKVFDERILKAAGIAPSQRPQEILFEDWLKIYKLYEPEKL